MGDARQDDHRVPRRPGVLIAAAGGLITIRQAIVGDDDVVLPSEAEPVLYTMLDRGCTESGIEVDVAMPHLALWDPGRESRFDSEVVGILDTQVASYFGEGQEPVLDWVTSENRDFGESCDTVPKLPAIPRRGPIASFDTFYLSPELVSVEIEVGHFPGAAYFYVEGIIYDVKRDVLISDADLFRPDIVWETEVSRLVCADFNDGDIRAECPLLADSLQRPGRIATDGAGLIFLFDECEVLMCASGTPTVHLEWDRLDVLLRDNDPVREALRR